MTTSATVATDQAPRPATIRTVSQHIVEFVSDSGEGAQTAGQLFGTIAAKSGNGVWTVEIIPAEVEPPARSRAGASGNRVRVGTKEVTNMGDTADIVIAFNEQVLYSRIDVGALKQGTMILLENKWAKSGLPGVPEAYAEALADFARRGYVVVEVPMEAECLKVVKDARRGKNIWCLGLLCAVYDLDMQHVEVELKRKLGKKSAEVVANNIALLTSGRTWGDANIEMRFNVPVEPTTQTMVVMNGNQAIALGAMAAGFEVCSMYPITPATSVSHHLASVFHRSGGFVHQAEDEIAAIGFALGCAYAGKTPLTVTSGPGLALKTEFIGLAVMAELPIVLVDVQRGGPSTGLPTRVEQGDLLSVLFAEPGDAPKIILAPATIAECFDFMITARKLAETFRGPVMVLTDANLATGQQPFPRPELKEEWLAPPIDQSAWDRTVRPYEWDPATGLSQRPIPGQRNGNYVLTGLAHDEHSRVAYESSINQHSMEMRSRKLATLLDSLKPPTVRGDDTGDLLVVGWGSTLGAIDEAIDRLRAEGHRISSVHLRYLSPMEPGLKEIFARFKKVMTVEINYSDDVNAAGFTAQNRRYSQLAFLLRAQTLCDVDCWSRVPGSPLSPSMIENALRTHLTKG
jgi:2-oxoglutarate ferredoxin oxidoreductase subunit alpha